MWNEHSFQSDNKDSYKRNFRFKNLANHPHANYIKIVRMLPNNSWNIETTLQSMWNKLSVSKNYLLSNEEWRMKGLEMSHKLLRL